MAKRLRVDYVSVRDIVSDIQTYESEIEEIYDLMDTTVNALVSEGYMEAESATAYVEEFENMLGPDIQSLKTLVASFHKQLTDICNNFEDADARIADMLK